MGLSAGVLRLLSALSELVLPTACAACRSPGPVACDLCARAVERSVPRPLTGGVWARSDPLGVGLALVREHKSRGSAGQRSLTPLLGQLLADSIRSAIADRSVGQVPVALVPVPSRRAARAARGREPLREITESACQQLRPLSVGVFDVVRWYRQPVDQRSLGVELRRFNVSGAMRARCPRLLEAAVVVAVDDVVTTGATLRELVRALTAEGVHVSGCAAIVSTPQRRRQ